MRTQSQYKFMKIFHIYLEVSEKSIIFAHKTEKI